ncbi:MAG: ferritin [Deltaproteobacteria bacterium]|nr:MAG: ferritin [Deltaproteobacteria bacterium]
MISEKLLKALNVQINKEWWSASIYKAMAAYCESEDLPGFANWFNVQTLEELTHGQRIFDFICEAGERVELYPMEGPKNDYESPLDAFTYGLEHEKLVTSLINDLMTIAKEENNHAAEIMLQWFVTEQVEEEASFGLIKKKLERVGDDGRGLLMLDDELATRAFTPPAPA